MSVIDSASNDANLYFTTNGNDNQSGLQAQPDITPNTVDTLSTFTQPNDLNLELSGYLQDNVLPAQAFLHIEAPTYPLLQQAPSVLTAEYTCVHLGCHKKYTRRPDMLRHAKVHDPNATRLDCSFSGCPRKGRQGFPRSDKLLAHERAHRRAMQKAQTKANRRG